MSSARAVRLYSRVPRGQPPGSDDYLWGPLRRPRCAGDLNGLRTDLYLGARPQWSEKPASREWHRVISPRELIDRYGILKIARHGILQARCPTEIAHWYE